MSSTIDVACVAFPDGTVIWTDRVESSYIDELMKAWRSAHSEDRLKELEGTLGGVVVLRMLPR